MPIAIRRTRRQRQVPATYPIFYDPSHPKRVWSRHERWLRANALPHIFLMIHMFQVMIDFLIIAKTFAPSTPQNEGTVGAISFAPFATQVVVMVLFGFCSGSEAFEYRLISCDGSRSSIDCVPHQPPQPH